MEIKQLTETLSVSPQISAADVRALREAGVRSIICNRPDGEAPDQPNYEEIERAARELGLETSYLPAVPGKVTDEQGVAFGKLLEILPKPIHAYCRTGTRSATMWALSQAGKLPLPEILDRASKAGHNLKGVVRRIANGGKTPTDSADATHEVVIVGGGAAGIAVAASLLARKPDLDVAIVDPADIHSTNPVGLSSAQVCSNPHRRPERWLPSCRAASSGSRRQLLPSNPKTTW